MAKITISYHRSLNELQAPRWGEDGPFARAEWFALLAQGASAPLFAVARAGDQAVALALQENGCRLEALSNWYAFSFAPLATCGISAVQRSLLIKALARDLAGRCSHLRLAKVPEERGEAADLAAALRHAGWLVCARPCETNHILRLEGRDYAQYLATRPGQLRSTIRRRGKHLSIQISTRFQAQDWAIYEDIYAQSWKPAEGDPALLRRFAEAESLAGRYRLGLARHEGDPVAAQFWSVDGTSAFIHKLAYRASAAALSPGTVLSAALAAHVIDKDRVEMIDFGTGDDPYKKDWMEAKRRRWHLTGLRPADPRNWPLMARLAARRIRDWPDFDWPARGDGEDRGSPAPIAPPLAAGDRALPRAAKPARGANLVCRPRQG